MTRHDLSFSFLDGASGDVATVELVGGQCLRIERDGDSDVLTLYSDGQRPSISIRVTPEGPVLGFEGGLRVQASGVLEFHGERVAINGAQGVSIRSGGDAKIEAAGDLTTTARIQNIRARLGNVNVKANDDVRLRGERVRLNC